MILYILTIMLESIYFVVKYFSSFSKKHIHKVFYILRLRLSKRNSFLINDSHYIYVLREKQVNYYFIKSLVCLRIY